MAAQINQETCACTVPGMEAYRQLVFPDGCRIRVKGLDRIFDDAYREGKRPGASVSNELVSRLSENNYIPSAAWSEYRAVVLKEYRKFFEAKEEIVVQEAP